MDKLFTFKINDILGVTIAGIIAYIVLILCIRLLGKRSTSKFNSIDWIVTVSVGSLFASTVLLKDISIFEGCIAIFFLLLLQFLTTKLILKLNWFQNVVKASPRLLLYKGEFIEEHLRSERVLKAEIYAEIRQSGLKSIKNIYAVVLETNSKISVIPNDEENEIGYSLKDVEGLPQELRDYLDRNKEKSQWEK